MVQDWFNHLYRYSAGEIVVDYQACCLMEIINGMQKNPLKITLKTLSKMLQCPESNCKSCLDLIQRKKLIEWRFDLDLRAILEGAVVINFNSAKVNKISTNSWSKTRAKDPRLGSVYLARSRATGLVKIGRSLNVQKRLKTLSTGSGEELELLIEIKSGDAVQLETKLHYRFNYCRVSREWFKLGHSEITEVVELAKRL